MVSPIDLQRDKGRSVPEINGTKTKSTKKGRYDVFLHNPYLSSATRATGAVQDDPFLAIVVEQDANPTSAARPVIGARETNRHKKNTFTKE